MEDLQKQETDGGWWRREGKKYNYMRKQTNKQTQRRG